MAPHRIVLRRARAYVPVLQCLPWLVVASLEYSVQCGLPLLQNTPPSRAVRLSRLFAGVWPGNTGNLADGGTSTRPRNLNLPTGNCVVGPGSSCHTLVLSQRKQEKPGGLSWSKEHSTVGTVLVRNLALRGRLEKWRAVEACGLNVVVQVHCWSRRSCAEYRIQHPSAVLQPKPARIL